ncbi:MAG: 5-(carboxyamino)imidazole ribonucleotide mutase [Candidatus Marinimicrobia bacterium]|nr:5-(carboxyamino)imidazole ribonucleotide mutase [Candidatus Neomarinimicrobiota bacterium]
MSENKPLVIIISGSKSDSEFVKATEEYLAYFQILYESKVLSAHRNPDQVVDYVSNARDNGVKCIIAQAGMAAHLAGVVAAHTTLPVIGVPLPGSHLNGVDSLYSTVQMPAGIPVATMAIGKAGARNAAVFAAEMLSVEDESVHRRLEEFRANGAKL